MGGSSSSHNFLHLKVLFGALVLVGVIFLLSAAPTLTSDSGGNFKHAYVMGREKLDHPELDLNFMSNRRVPNGPDPIHNRRAGNSGRPLGRGVGGVKKRKLVAHKIRRLRESRGRLMSLCRNSTLVFSSSLINYF